MIETGGISLDVSTTRDFLTEKELLGYSLRVEEAATELTARTSPGADWICPTGSPNRNSWRSRNRPPGPARIPPSAW